MNGLWKCCKRMVIITAFLLFVCHSLGTFCDFFFRLDLQYLLLKLLLTKKFLARAIFHKSFFVEQCRRVLHAHAEKRLFPSTDLFISFSTGTHFRTVVHNNKLLCDVSRNWNVLCDQFMKFSISVRFFTFSATILFSLSSIALFLCLQIR